MKFRMSLDLYLLLWHCFSLSEVLVGWLMLWLVTMEVRGSNSSCGVVQTFKAFKWSICLRGLRSGPHAWKSLRSGLHVHFIKNFLNFYYLIYIILMTCHNLLAHMLLLGKIDKPHHQTIASITIKTNMPLCTY